MRNLVGLAVQQITACSPLMASYKLIASHTMYSNHSVDSVSVKTSLLRVLLRNGGNHIHD
jgi:hypothetical protein